MDDKDKVLLNIEPFNDLFYKSCFYNSAFPVLKYFNKNIISILIHDVVLYAYEKGTSRRYLQSEYVQTKSLEELLVQEGIRLNCVEKSNSLINDIIKSISEEKPVIIWIDCYYASIRQDKYQKEHWPHTRLVYGYDKTNQEILIIEHDHSDNLSYEKRTVSFEEMIDCYEGYFKHLSITTNKYTYFDFETLDNIEVQGVFDQKKAYMENIHRNKYTIMESLTKLDEFITDYETIITDQECLKDCNVDLLHGFNQIINAKRMQLYSIQHLFGQNNQFTLVIEKIVEAWGYIRGIIAKCYYSSIYREKSLIKSMEQLHIISELEHKWLNLFLGELDFNE